MPQYIFAGDVLTQAGGIQQLASFYSTCKKFQSCTVTIGLDKVKFFDANLSSLFMALAHKLMMENQLKFFIDYRVFSNASLGVLKRNGLGKLLCNLKDEVYDNRESVIPVNQFNIDDADGFTCYIERDLLKHRGLENVTYSKKKELKSSYFEIFDNVGIHANTTYPVCVCGQYYPYLKELKFTLVDLGEGFLKKIVAYTAKQPTPITMAPQAISWAVRGGSTKVNAEGGNGLKKILKYCRENNGALHIYSDGSYWVYDGAITSHIVKTPFMGSTISLIFRNL